MFFNPEGEQGSELGGDYRDVYSKVESAVQAALASEGLTIPIIDGSLYGDWKIIQRLPATTSSVFVVENNNFPEEIVVKVLREPIFRTIEKDSGRSQAVFNQKLGHPLFPWSGINDDDLDLGILLQKAALEGELSAGTWYNPIHNPYLGMVGVSDIENGRLRLTPIDQISVESKIWPGLVMELKPTNFNVGKIVYEWNSGEWPELTEQDIKNLATDAILTYDLRAIPAGDWLKNRYGTVDFFLRCMVYETPELAANMDKWPNADQVIKRAAQAAEYIRRRTEAFILENPEYIEREVVGRVVIGHADTKFTNTLMDLEDREAVVNAIKSREVPFVILDAQSLFVKPGIFKNPGSRGQVPSFGINYAHWRIVPREQQWAYAAMQFLGMGRADLYIRVLRELERITEVKFSNKDRIWLHLQTAYKLGTVEPLVNAGNWLSNSVEMNNPILEMTMVDYPKQAVQLINRFYT